MVKRGAMESDGYAADFSAFIEIEDGRTPSKCRTPSDT